MQIGEPGQTGIQNLGNTCYLNSILQCLASNERLKDYFLNGYYQTDLNRTNRLGCNGQLAQEFSIIIDLIWSGQHRIISPDRLKQIIGQFKPRFNNKNQQDSQELLICLLDGLHEDLNRVNICLFNFKI